MENRNKILQQQLGMFIYELAEINFSCITKEFFDKHINNQEPFTDKQIKSFEEMLKESEEELKDAVD